MQFVRVAAVCSVNPPWGKRKKRGVAEEGECRGEVHLQLFIFTLVHNVLPLLFVIAIIIDSV